MRVSIDSRTIQPGDYFIPVKGERFDGHLFIEEALKKGGRLLDVDLVSYAKKYRKKLKARVIGVTGSAGKTTVKDLLFSVLSQQFKVVATKENQNNEVGVPLTILSADEDTDVVIVEMGMRHKGDMSFLAQIVCPTDVVITGIGLSHVELFKSAADIARAKGEIFRNAQVWEGPSRNAYINFSSKSHNYLAKKAQSRGYHVFPYEGVDKPDQNMNLCYLVGRHFGLSDAQIQEGIATFQSSAHRLKRLPGLPFVLIDDTYNANPDGVEYALQYLKRFSGRKILVLGDMLELGSYTSQAHLDLIPHIIDAQIDVVFTFGVLAKVLEASLSVSVSHFDTKEALHLALKDEVKPGDVILVKGSRGMKMEESVAFLAKHYGH